MDSLIDKLVHVTLKAAETSFSFVGILFSVHQGHIIVFSEESDEAFVIKESEIKSCCLYDDAFEIKDIVFRVKAKRGRDQECPPSVKPSYWEKRYFLFSKFDDGVQLDETSWFSVTPELIAKRIAEKCRCSTILDVCTGAGGNAIQFALTCDQVIACDMDNERLKLAAHNAEVYGVKHNIEFVLANAMDLLRGLPNDSIDVVFLSPPWGGPGYQKSDTFSLRNDVKLLGGNDGVDLFKEARRVARNGVAYFLPRNVEKKSILK